jgi:hypothetical protein
MIFDLRGKRKRVVQVVYAGLAVLFAISFIGFGVGSGNGVGGIFDQIFGTGDSSPSNPEFQSRIDAAQKALDANPKDEDALIELATVNAQTGDSEVDVDPKTGAPIMTTDAATAYAAATSAWQRYLDLKPKKPDDAIAAQLLSVYFQQLNNLISASPPDIPAIKELLGNAVKTAAIVAAAQPSSNSYGTLAQLAYLAGDNEQGDQAASQAVEKSSKSSRQSTQNFVDAAKKSGASFQTQLAKAEKASQTSPEQAFSNPLSDSLGSGGLSGGTSVPPATGP